MKKPKVLKGFKHITGKKVCYIEELSHEDEDMYIITEDKKILAFCSNAEYNEHSECCESTIEFYDFENIKHKITTNTEVRNILLQNEVIDQEYIDRILSDYYKPIKEMICHEVIGATLVSEEPIDETTIEHTGNITLYDSNYNIIIGTRAVTINQENNQIHLLANGRFKNAKYYHRHQY